MRGATTVEQFTRIPDELKADESWVLWRYERRPGTPQPTKVLRQVSGHPADTTKPETWTTFEQAAEAYEQGSFDGVGFVFHPGNPFAGADMDGVTEEEAQNWIDRFDSYTERSPSGNGFHIILKASVPKGTNRAEGELYSFGRFFTMTGDVVRDAPVREAQDAADEFYAFLRRGDSTPTKRAPSTPALTDAEVVRLAEAARKGAEFSTVYRGGGQFKSGSERDLSLASRLAFWTQDEGQIERIMRGSGCVREKWDRHRTYLRDTIRKALDGLTETYTPPGERADGGAFEVRRNGRPPGGPGAGGEDPPGNDGHGSPPHPQRFNLTDLGNSERFVADHGENVRYCYLWNKWLVWIGTRWERDDSGRVHRLAKETVRGIYREAAAAEDDGQRKALAKHAAASEAESRIRAMLELAKSELPVSPDELDADPWLLNAKNGTIDLRFAALREHRRTDLITKIAPVRYDPEAAAPAWEVFLERVLPGEDLRDFVRRAAGYSATGDTSEQVMFINHGAGNNGKSTFQEALAAALGDYSMRAPTEMLMAKRSGGVPNDVARLKGSRFVTASETEEGRRLAESLVKDLTGQDTISARFMRAEFFDFRPTHKLWLSTNHKPEIRGTDNAIWRRIRLIPWAVTVPPAERDRKLPERLRSELPGILAWIVRGCLEWQRLGLQAPEEVRAATSSYRAEMDVLAAFVEDRCVVDPNAWAKFSVLWAAWQEWCEEAGEKPETKRRFGSRLSERGFEPDRGTGNVPIRPGIGLLEERQTATEEGSRVTPEGESYPSVTPENPSKSADSSAESYPSYPETHITPGKIASRGVNGKNGNLGNLGNSEAFAGDASRETNRRLTAEEAERVQRLIEQGMSPALARAQVLGEGDAS